MPHPSSRAAEEESSTLCLKSGFEGDAAQEAKRVVIYQTTVSRYQSLIKGQILNITHPHP
jgi:O-acetylhomoserine/O-acetylserine sulfhydrylase-like pyridoxal-dependent enzyme